MLWRGTACAAAALALALGGCGGGDDDGGDSSAPPKAPVVRCTPGKAGGKVNVRPKWKIGDRRTIDIQKSREDTELDEPVHMKGTAQVQVIDAGSKGSSLRWQAGPVSFPTAIVLIPDAKMDEIEDKVDPLRIEYGTDADGVVEAVGNLSSLRSQVSAVLTVIAEETGRDREVEALRRVAESDAFLQTAMVEDIGNLHHLYGVAFERGETIRGDYELPNPFGGEPVASTASYTLTTPRDKSGCAVINGTIEADPDAIADMLEEGLGQLAGPGEAPDRSEFEDMELRHEMSFSFDPGSGWIVRADARKIITLGERKRTERTVMVTR